MRNLFDIDKIQQIPRNQTIQNHHSFVFLSGVVKYNRCFDISGDLIDGRVIATPNFSAELVSFSEATEELEINWTNDAFDYYGVVALKNELMFINTTGDDGIAPIRTSTGTLKIKINQRCLFGTFKQEHSAGEVLRSVVNITEGTVSYKAENKTSISSNMFAPAVATGSISIFDDVRRWIYYNDNGIFDVKVKTPIYIYSGLDGKTILDYLGFITNCDISFNEQSIEIDFANKLSIYWDEDLNMNKVFTDITIKSVLSQVLGLNEGAIKYPRYFDANGNELIEYTDDDFFTVDVIATKEFETYQAFLTTLCNEMMCRITFNGDDLVIQSEVMKTKNNTNNIKNAILVTEYDNIISMTDKTSDDAIFNKIESTFLVRTPYYNEDFKWTTKEYPNEAAFLADSANYGTFDIAIILDTKEYFKKEVVNTGDTYIKQFVNKGTISDYHLEEGFSKPIKYEFESSNVKCDNGKGLIYQNNNGDWYFNTVTVVVGANASYLNIGEPYQYVMLTDGRKDFTGVPVDLYIDEFDSSKNTATFIFGFDRDSNNYERGYVDYTLIPMGYDDADKTYHLYYGRLDMLYSYEYNVDDITYCIKKPLIAGETVTLAATFGGVDTPDGKFSGVVAWLNAIYDTVFTKDELLYNREYHQEIPVYVKSNTIKKDTTNNYLDYATFENDKLALQIKKTNTIVKETLSFDVTDVSSYNTFDDTSADMFAKFTNTTFGFKIKFLSTITVGSTTLPMVNDLSSDGSYTALDFTYDEIKNPTGDTNIAQYYKVEYNGKIYFVDKDYTERFYSIADDNFISRTNIISVDASSILVNFSASKFQIGDLIKLAKSNEDNYNCSFNYARYNDNDFFIVWFEDEYYSNGARAGLRIYFDYEMPVGLLNTFMELEHHKAEDILVLQEFAIRGNPYYDKEIPINYENEESIDRYGEKKYDSFTGKMMKLSDLKTAVNYLVNGFSATSKETTKKIFTIKSDLMFDLDVLDFIMIDERIYTGMTHDSSKAVIISKSIDNSNGQLTNTFTCMTVGAFEFKNTSLTKTITTTYEPETLPVYSHSGSATGTSTNVLDVIDVVVSLFDDYLGSVSLIKVADGNLVINTLERYDANSTIMSFGNFSPLYTSDTTGMTDEQIYNAQVANQKLETYASNIFQVDKEGFVLIGTEYIYFTTKSLTKIADPISSDVTDKITTSVTVEVKQRGCFETVKSTNIPTNTTATVFSIASITNADGIYTLATTMGNIASRDYLSFNIEDGLAIETDRGKLLINTEDEYLQNIADKFGVIGVDLDSLGKGLVQIGNSSGQFIRYTPVTGLEYRGSVDIDAGSLKINIDKNNISLQKNFMRLDEGASLLGFNIPATTPIPTTITSLLQFGLETDSNFLMYKVQNNNSIFKLKVDALTVNVGGNNKFKLLTQPSIFNYNEILFREMVNLTLGDTTTNNYLDVKFVGPESYMKIASQNILFKTDLNEINLTPTNGSIILKGDSTLNLSDILVFTKTGTTSNLTLTPNILDLKTGDTLNQVYFNSASNAISRLIMTGEVDFTLGNLTNGLTFTKRSSNIDFKLRAQNVLIGDTAGTNYIQFETNSPTSGKLYFNGGRAQIGKNIANGFDGFFFGDTDLDNGKYIKYSYSDAAGSKFALGQKTTMYQGETPILAIDSLVSEAYDTLNTGSTVTSGDLMKIYGHGRFTDLTLNGDISKTLLFKSITGDSFNQVKINTLYTSSGAITNSTLLNFVSGLVTAFALNSTYLSKLIDFSIRFINQSLATDYFELKIQSLDSTNIYFASYGKPTINAIYKVQFEKIQSAHALIGNMTTSEIINPRIMLGWRDNGTEEVLFKITSADSSNYIDFSTLDGTMKIKSTGLIDISNTANQLKFNSTSSFISMNSGKQQFGYISGLTGLSNNVYGLFTGNSITNPTKYIYATDSVLSIKTDSLQIDTGASTTLDSFISMNNGRVQFGKLTTAVSTASRPYGVYIGNNVTKASATNYLYADGTIVDIKATSLYISAGNAIIDMNTTNSSIKLTGLKLGYINEGTANLAIDYTGKSGIYVGNKTNYLSYNSTDSILNLQTSNGFTIGDFTYNSSTYNGVKIGDLTNYLGYGYNGTSYIFAVKMTSGNMDLSGSTLNLSATTLNLASSSIMNLSSTVINLNSSSTLNIKSGNTLSMQSGSIMNLSSSTMNLTGTSIINLNSGNAINIESGSSLNIKTGSNISLITNNFILDVTGNIKMSNTKNKIELKTDNTSQLLLNQSSLSTIPSTVVFAVSDKIIYDRATDILSIKGNIVLDSYSLGYGTGLKIGKNAISTGNDGLNLTGTNIGGQTSFLRFNTTTGDVDLTTFGDVDIRNTSSRLYMDSASTNSQFLLNVADTSLYSDVDFRIGGGYNDYIQFDKELGVSIATNSLKIANGEIMSENVTQTERVIMNYGKVINQKRNSTSEEYKTYDQLVMQFTGTVNCVNGWSETIDFKTYNNKLAWSNLNIVAFIVAQYDLATNGVATSREIKNEWVGAISDQKMRFRVSGGNLTNVTTTITYNFLSSTSTTLTNVKSINISGTVSTGVIGGGVRTTSLWIKIGNQAEILIVKSNTSGNVDKAYSYSVDIGYPETITLRWSGPYRPTASGSYIRQTANENVVFNAVVQWLAIGNS
jgi:hypothetical protein